MRKTTFRKCRIIPSILISCVFFICSQTEATKPEKEEPTSKYTFTVNMPAIIREDIVGRYLALIPKIFPDADMDALKKEMSPYIENRQGTVRAYKAPGAYLFLLPDRTDRIVATSLTNWQDKGFWIKELTLEMNIKLPDAPISYEKAGEIANEILEKLIPDAEERKSLILQPSEENEASEFYYFRWQRKFNRQYEIYSQSGVYLTIRKKDGWIQSGSIGTPIGEPNISFEEIAEKAKGIIPSFNKKKLGSWKNTILLTAVWSGSMQES